MKIIKESLDARKKNDINNKARMVAGYCYDWDVKNQPECHYAMEKLTSRIHNGAVILLHSTSETNALILDEFIDCMLAEGYVFKPLSDLCN